MHLKVYEMKVSLLLLLLLYSALCLLVTGKSIPLRRPRRNAYRDKQRLWPESTVPVSIDEAYSYKERKIIESAFQEIADVSCIRFLQYSGENAFVNIVRGKGCRAVVGYTGRRQQLTLGYGCIWQARVLHELLHVLGFFHEHTRPDRDDYVTINKHNIQESAFIKNFQKTDPVKITTFDLPYDYNSVLHYHDREFAVDRNLKTLEPRKKDAIIGKSSSLSPLDIVRLNKLYECHSNDDALGSGDLSLEENFIIVK